METKEAIDKIKLDLSEFKAQGHTSVAIESFENYLAGIEKDATLSIEYRKLEHLNTLAHYDAQSKSNLEMSKSVLDSGKEALNAVLLINGGAVVVLMGFLGSVLSKGGSETLSLKLTIPLLSFGFGVLFSALSSGLRYCAQFSYAKRWENSGHSFNLFSVLSTIAAYSTFGYGICMAYEAFAKHFTH